MRLQAPAAATLLLLAGLAGCLGQGDGTATVSSSTTSPSPWPPLVTLPPCAPEPSAALPGFDGEAALDYVECFALRTDGTPRYRMPGTEGQQEGMSYLWREMDLPGWSRHWQNLTGKDYLALDRSVVGGYGHGTRSCSEADAALLPGYTFHNLYAIRRSGVPDAPLFLVGAHWDSQRRSDMDSDPAKRNLPDPGANDGASGVGLLLQLMRELDGVALPFDIGVIFLDGEDGFFDCYPLAGSLYFAQNLPLDVHRFLLLDMVGDAAARYPREAHSEASDKALLDLLWRHGRALGGGDSFIDVSRQIADDHVAFIQAGIPSVDVIDAGRPSTFPPYWDTTSDTVDNLSADMLALVGDTILAAVQDPAFVEGWPVQHRPG